MNRHRRIAANQRAHPDFVGSAIDIDVDHRHGALQGQLDDMRGSYGASSFFTILDGDQDVCRFNERLADKHIGPV